jgi:hypothetical protein
MINRIYSWLNCTPFLYHFQYLLPHMFLKLVSHNSTQSTRVTYNVPGGEGEYNLDQRKVGFQKADQLANTDELVRVGVQVTPIVELVVRNHNFISLEGSVPNSHIRKYTMENELISCITSNDLRINDLLS